MSAKNPAPGPQPERFAAYLNRLAHAAGRSERAASAGVAADRVAEGTSRAHPVLVVHLAGGWEARRTGAVGQASLDHRTGLPGAEARTGTGALRRTRLARIPPSRHALHRGLWVPGVREEPFFPLGATRSTGLTRSHDSSPLAAPRLAACGPSGIIRARSQPCASGLPGSFSGSSPAALFVAPYVYNTVVLGCVPRQG